MGTRITWAVLVVLYVIFFSWYTSFGGPLSDEEVAYYVALVENSDPTAPPNESQECANFWRKTPGTIS